MSIAIVVYKVRTASPSFSSIHPRYKRKIADRFALGAFQVAYQLPNATRFQGPFPTNLRVTGNHVDIEFDNGTASLDYRGVDGWEVL